MSQTSTRSTRGRRAFLLLAALAVLSALVYLGVRAQPGGNRKKVYTEAARREAIVQTVEASGRIDPKTKVEISSQLVAKITRLYVREGEDVALGAPFLELESTAFVAARDSLRAQLRSARSELRRAEVRQADVEIELARARRLSEEGIRSLESLQAVELKLKSAEIDLDQARESLERLAAELTRAEEDLAKTRVFAPLAGRVIHLAAEEGEVVVSGTMNNPASVIGTIADLSEILAEVEVGEADVPLVAIGQPVEVEVDAIPDRVYAGRVSEIGSSGVSSAQQPDVTVFVVKVLLDEPDRRLLPGMSVRAEIRVADHGDALVVPLQSVVERNPLASPASDAGVDVVFVVADEIARQRPVTLGISDLNRVEITAGLETGEQVVTGPDRVLGDLEDGDRVRVTPRSSKRSEPSGAQEP